VRSYINKSTFIMLAFSFIFISCDNSDDPHYADANYDSADMVRGGLLYDKWWTINGSSAPTTDFDPLWSSQSTNSRAGADTWRCKECHGWDYVGKDGRYGSGSHFTGFNGVMNGAATTHSGIFDAIKDAGGDHDLSSVLTNTDVLDLTKFIAEGLIDMSYYLDASNQGTGDAVNGLSLYTTNCEFCHGADGKSLDFVDNVDGIQGVGFLSNDNPQEVFHKIRWGHPGSDPQMPSMIETGLSDDDTGDILTYIQSLPE